MIPDEQISVDPKIMCGKPCFAGTRIPVYLIFERLGAGETVQELFAAYPDLTPDRLLAAFRYAAALAQEEVGIVGGGA